MLCWMMVGGNTWCYSLVLVGLCSGCQVQGQFRFPREVVSMRMPLPLCLGDIQFMGLQGLAMMHLLGMLEGLFVSVQVLHCLQSTLLMSMMLWMTWWMLAKVLLTRS